MTVCTGTPVLRKGAILLAELWLDPLAACVKEWFRTYETAVRCMVCKVDQGHSSSKHTLTVLRSADKSLTMTDDMPNRYPLLNP